MSTQRKAEKAVGYLKQYRYCDDGVKLRIVRRTIVVETEVMK
jgi:hypothetical protein